MSGGDPTALLAAAQDWIEPYWNADHLRRTLHWLLVLDPHASAAARIAALTHDMERHVPGGPVFDPGTMAPGDRAYRAAHSERSAEVVSTWLAGQDADPELVAAVRELVALHEVGGTPEADLVQAADSLSFLETNGALVRGWVDAGRCGPERARRQLGWMLERIRIERARDLARPLYAAAAALIDEPGG